MWIFHGTDTQDTVWIFLKYERLHDLCYTCGRLNHSAKDCHLTDNLPKSIDPRFAFGPWLRVFTQGLEVPTMKPWQPQPEATVASLVNTQIKTCMINNGCDDTGKMKLSRSMLRHCHHKSLIQIVLRVTQPYEHMQSIMIRTISPFS